MIATLTHVVRWLSIEQLWAFLSVLTHCKLPFFLVDHGGVRAVYMLMRSIMCDLQWVGINFGRSILRRVVCLWMTYLFLNRLPFVFLSASADFFMPRPRLLLVSLLLLATMRSSVFSGVLSITMSRRLIKGAFFSHMFFSMTFFSPMFFSNTFFSPMFFSYTFFSYTFISYTMFSPMLFFFSPMLFSHMLFFFSPMLFSHMLLFFHIFFFLLLLFILFLSLPILLSFLLFNRLLFTLLFRVFLPFLPFIINFLIRFMWLIWWFLNLLFDCLSWCLLLFGLFLILSLLLDLRRRCFFTSLFGGFLGFKLFSFIKNSLMAFCAVLNERDGLLGAICFS